MHIYTKFGDRGQTSLLGGKTVDKDDPRVEAYGSVDELNAILGVVLSSKEGSEIAALILEIQNDLFVIGSELASAEKPSVRLKSTRVGELELAINEIEELVPPLRNFILPGGTEAASLLHLARTVCRRAERKVISLNKISPVNPDIIVYLNRLSDLLFMLARKINYKKKKEEKIWRGR
ncbi:cob(I)yrinic acid a,c-diamide adenosyltransferase [Candidatus Micrarchaeota archaeon]|nr:cob(I)yrinic acid a,c-diamide adenosyltransferase [Candidatus Micrarchaeota archaeon]